MRCDILILTFVLLTCFLTSGLATVDCGQVNNMGRHSSFEHMTRGTICFDLFVSESDGPVDINILHADGESEQIIFSIPIEAGSKFYPQEVIPDAWNHIRLDIAMEQNFCKAHLNGQWLTSSLSVSQADSVNRIKIQSGKESCMHNVANLMTNGKMLDLSEPLRIVAFGDSTTAFRRTITGVYSQRIPEYFKEQNKAVRVINAGVGGSHTGRLADNSRHRVQHALDRFEQDVLAKEPDIVILSFGINDSWVDHDVPSGQSRIKLEDYRENLRFMIQKLHETGVAVILMTPNQLGKNQEIWRHQRLYRYVEVARKFAVEESIPLVDQWTLFTDHTSSSGLRPDDFLLDGVHPNDSWHEIVTKRILDLILKNIEK